MLAILKLIRIQNLLIVAATQYLLRYAVIQPILSINNFELQLSGLNFFILVFSTICLTAAGYVINDYFDTKTDAFNKPEKVVVDKMISRRGAMALHIVLNMIGVIGGFYVSGVIGHLKFGFIFILITGILWYYSTTYKRQFLIGNILVSLLTALVPLMVILYEMPLLNVKYGSILIEHQTNFNRLLYWILAFSFFAFVTTLIREIIKDTEDFEGDSAYGRNSLPIVLGINYTKLVLIILISGTIASFAIIYLKYLTGFKFTLWYLIVFQITPLIYLAFRIIRANTKKDYTFASGFMKIIMLGGLLYSLVAAYNFLFHA